MRGPFTSLASKQGTRPVTDVKSLGNNAVGIPESRVGTTDSLRRRKGKHPEEKRKVQFLRLARRRTFPHG